jgi:predicted flap endonuclease-1-like 5' DNA nuclease
MKDLHPPEGSGFGACAPLCAGLVAATGPLEGLLRLPTVLIAVVLAVALGVWVGWMLAGIRTGSRRRAEEAWESEVARAAGCARDRATEEKEQLEQRLDRLQAEHGRCGKQIDGLAERLRDHESAAEAMKKKLVAAVEAKTERDGRIRALDRRVEELETSIEERNHRDGTPDWLLAEPDGVGDDLTAIRGLGQVLEQRLNDLGIHLYRQLAKMTSENAHWIAMKIHVVPGRILRDGWAEQARELHRRKYSDPA